MNIERKIENFSFFLFKKISYFFLCFVVFVYGCKIEWLVVYVYVYLYNFVREVDVG